MSWFNYDGKCTCGAQSIFDCRCDLSNKCRSAIAQNGEDAWPRKTQKMDLNEFSKINIQRSTSADGFSHPMDKWSVAEWTNAMCGEAGEAANIAKKMIRKRDGIAGPYRSDAALREDLLKELADTVTYADLCAQSVGGDLSEALRGKFDEVSIRLGFPHRMPAVQPPNPSWGMVEKLQAELDAATFKLGEARSENRGLVDSLGGRLTVANRKLESEQAERAMAQVSLDAVSRALCGKTGCDVVGLAKASIEFNKERAEDVTQLNAQKAKLAEAKTRLEKQAEHHDGDMARLEAELSGQAEQLGAIGKALGLSPEASHDTMIVLAKKRAGSRSRYAQLERENRTLKGKLTDARKERDERREHMKQIATALGIIGFLPVVGEKLVASAKELHTVRTQCVHLGEALGVDVNGITADTIGMFVVRAREMSRTVKMAQDLAGRLSWEADVTR